MAMDGQEVVARIRQNGWCIVEGVIPEAEVGRVRESIVRTVAAHKDGPPDEVGVTTTASRGLVNLDQSFAPYLADERILGTATELWGDFVRITITTPVLNPPGGSPRPWHADWPFNQMHPVAIKQPFPDFPMLMTVILMLSDFTAENGGTLLAPGSHRSLHDWDERYGESRVAPHHSQVQAIAKAGSALLFDSRTWHSVPTNQTTEVRVGVTIRYAPWWLNLNLMLPGSPEREYMTGPDGDPERNKLLPMPRGVFDSLPSNVQPLFRHWVEPEGGSS